MSRDPEALDDLEAALALCADPVERARISLALGRAQLPSGPARASGIKLPQRDLRPRRRTPELRLMLEAEALNADRLRGVGRERPRELEGEVAGGSTPGERAALAHVAAEAVATGERNRSEVAEIALRAWHSGTMIAEAGPEAALISFLGTTLAWCEEWTATLELCEAQLEAGRRRHAPVTISYALALRAGNPLRLGDLASAEADAEAVVSSLPASDPLAQMIAFGWLLESLVGRGRAREAAERLSEQRPDRGASGHRHRPLPAAQPRGRASRQRRSGGRRSSTTEGREPGRALRLPESGRLRLALPGRAGAAPAR